MEQSTIGQPIFKKMLLYHYFRQGDNYQTASRKLCHDYGENFVSLKLARQTYECIRRPDFDFDKFSIAEADTETENGFASVPDYIDLECEQSMAIDSILPNSPSKRPFELISSPSSGTLPFSSTPAIKVAKNVHPSTSQTPSQQFTEQTPSDYLQVLNFNELRPYFIPPAEMSECSEKIIKRWRVRRCFESNYSLNDTCTVLNELFEKNYVNHNFVNQWFDDFKRGYFSIESRYSPGRNQVYEHERIVEFFTQNPHASVKDGHYYFPKISSQALLSIIKANGFERRFNTWTRRSADEPDVSDEMLAEYKLRHPEAKAWEIGQHFGVYHVGIDNRLRAMGFIIPKEPKKKKKNNADPQLSNNEDSSNSSIVNELSDLMSELDDGNNSLHATSGETSSLLSFQKTVYTPKNKTHAGGRHKGSKNIVNKNLLIDPLTGRQIFSITDPAFIRLKSKAAEIKKKSSKEQKMKISEALSNILDPPVGSPRLPPIPKLVVKEVKIKTKKTPHVMSRAGLVQSTPVTLDDSPSAATSSSTPARQTSIQSQTKKRAKKNLIIDYGPDVLELPDEVQVDSPTELTFDPLSNLDMGNEVFSSSDRKKPLSTSKMSNVVKVKLGSLPDEIISTTK